MREHLLPSQTGKGCARHERKRMEISVYSYNTKANAKGYFASVVLFFDPKRNQGSWEVAIVRNGEIQYNTGLTSDVARFDGIWELNQFLAKVEAL